MVKQKKDDETGVPNKAIIIDGTPRETLPRKAAGGKKMAGGKKVAAGEKDRSNSEGSIEHRYLVDESTTSLISSSEAGKDYVQKEGKDISGPSKLADLKKKGKKTIFSSSGKGEGASNFDEKKKKKGEKGQDSVGHSQESALSPKNTGSSTSAERKRGSSLGKEILQEKKRGGHIAIAEGEGFVVLELEPGMHALALIQMRKDAILKKFNLDPPAPLLDRYQVWIEKCASGSRIQLLSQDIYFTRDNFGLGGSVLPFSTHM